MAETQRQPVPRNDGGELDTAMAFLTFARECVIKKADALSDTQLRLVLVNSGTSLLGLIKHLTVSERWWFGYHLLGVGDESDFDFGMELTPADDIDTLTSAYRLAIADSDAAILRIGDPDALTARPVGDRPLSLRWVLAHMTSEVARHAGHADIIREQIDGTTGR